MDREQNESTKPGRSHDPAESETSTDDFERPGVQENSVGSETVLAGVEDETLAEDLHAMEDPAAGEAVEGLKLREYQKEMVQMSLERNIIAAMATGSGKTFIVIEENMNAICKTPKRHLGELQAYVYQPSLTKLSYRGETHSCPLLQSLWTAYGGLDIHEDPYVVDMRTQATRKSLDKMEQAIAKRKTFCQDQLKRLCNTSQTMADELGPWAANYYIATSLGLLRSALRSNDYIMAEWDHREKHYLLKVLDGIDCSKHSFKPTDEPLEISEKMNMLLEFLVQQHKPEFTGLMFADRRAAVAVLYQIITRHPRTRDLFSCATFIGSSNSASRRNGVTELLDPKGQRSGLDDLRIGTKNLMIATSVLEEGIDVSACHIVICFNKPQNLKSFVQRRGRARMIDSSYIVMLEESDKVAKNKDWQVLEDKMKEAYLDDMRELKAMEERESVQEDSARVFKIESTGALLTFDNAISHLNHFCSVIPRDPYVDNRPDFSTSQLDERAFTSTVDLPTSVYADVRHSVSREVWQTERMARKDAAFEAFVALYNAGLVNDNLLPLVTQGTNTENVLGPIDERPSMVHVAVRINPWNDVVNHYDEHAALYPASITMTGGSKEPLEMTMYLPAPALSMPVLTMFWNNFVQFKIATEVNTTAVEDADLCLLAQITYLLHSSAFPHRTLTSRRDFVAFFVPRNPPEDLATWHASHLGSRSAVDVHRLVGTDVGHHVVRDLLKTRTPYTAKSWANRKPDLTLESPEEEIPEELHVEAVRLPKRSDFLHPVEDQSTSGNAAHTAVTFLRASHCEIEQLPFEYFRFALFIPSILHRYEIFMAAEQLRTSILQSVHYPNLELLVTAISASSAREDSDYQRLEFLGDSTLKMCASMQLLADRPREHEGYLSARKDRVVSNGRLARAALERGLDAFILTEPFRSHKWRPLYRDDVLKQTTAAQREISTKILADVVEALFGAAYIEGDFPNALKCLRVFLPELSWEPLHTNSISLYDLSPSSTHLPPYMVELERLIGHTFTKKTLLLEALTHSSFTDNLSAMSYQRLEFLGDAILDHLIVTRLFTSPRTLTQGDMYWHRAALVNGNFLAFLCLDWSISQSRVEISQSRSPRNQSSVVFTPIDTSVTHSLWQFMRHSSSAIVRAQTAVAERHTELRPAIRAALDSAPTYPWSLLARLQPDKFFSDLVESVLGAVFLDTRGDMAACEAVAERVGILPYLRRIVDEGVDLVHPKGRLGMMAGTRKVAYRVGVEGMREERRGGNMSKGRHWCEVRVDEKVVARVERMESKEEAVTKAAEEGTKALSEG
ncbi:MAG: Dicer-like protein 2 [Piccolia ochrophora]|nr:MAG: Dicer-like protein 2 [Piccolia ochrophora]